jgi:hypothetical protein
VRKLTVGTIPGRERTRNTNSVEHRRPALTIIEAADQILATAPELTPEQRAKLAGLFSTTRGR